MQQTHIVFEFLFPSRQDAPKAVHPTVCPLHDPATGLVAHFPFDRLGLFAPRDNVSRVLELHGQVTHLVVVVSFVQTQPLRLPLRWLRPSDRNALDRPPGQLEINPVRPVHGQPDRDAPSLGEEASLDAPLGPIGRIRAGAFPPRAAPCSSPRPSTATTSRCPSRRRIPPTPRPRSSGTPRPSSIPGIAGEPTNS